jgi:MFS family permease
MFGGNRQIWRIAITMITDSSQQVSTRLLFIHLFLISLSLIMLEIISTRLAKIIFLYQQYQAVVSLALLGIGLGGTVAFYINKRFPNKLLCILDWLTWGYTLSTILGPLLIAFLKKTTAPDLVQWVFYCFLSISYLLAGTLIAIHFQKQSSKIPAVYAASMVGSAVGGMLSIILLNTLGNERTLLILAALTGLANLCIPHTAMEPQQGQARGTIKYAWGGIWHGGPTPKAVVPKVRMDNRSQRYRKIGLILFFFFIAIIYLFYPRWLTVPCKGNIYHKWPEMFRHLKPIALQSNAFSYLETYQLGHDFFILLDCIGQTNIVKLSGQKKLLNSSQLSKNSSWAHLLTISPYQFKKDITSALVIGSGGGLQTALLHEQGCPHITAVEINPLIIKMTEELIPSQRNVYRQKNVRLLVQEGRHYLAQDFSQYDLIYLYGVKRYGGIGIRNLLLLENYLLTKEAFISYLAHLNDSGILFLFDYNEFISRYLNTLLQVLHEQGMNPIDHLLIVTDDKKTSTIIVKKTAWDREAVYNSFSLSQKIKDNIIFLQPSDVTAALSSQPITDDRPYFLMATPASAIPMEKMLENLLSIKAKKTVFLHLVKFLSVAAGVWLLSIFLTTFYCSHPRPLKVLSQSVYFSCLGAGFIIMEMAFIQQFTLFLDNPSYTLAVILSTLLLFSGFGGFWSQRISTPFQSNKIFFFTCALCLYMLILVPCMSSIISYSLKTSLFQRILTVIVMIGPAAFLMGIPLPLGMEMIRKHQTSLIPLMWGINGIASVLGGMIALLIAIIIGTTGLFAIAIAIYFLAGCLTVEKLSSSIHRA